MQLTIYRVSLLCESGTGYRHSGRRRRKAVDTRITIRHFSREKKTVDTYGL